MIEKESYGQSRNVAVVILAILFVVALIVAIGAMATVSKRNAALVQMQQEKDNIQAQADQKMQEADRIMADADSLRKVALKWTMEHQKQIQEQQKKGSTTAKSPTKSTGTSKAKSASHR